jgi:hypothetical protein
MHFASPAHRPKLTLSKAERARAMIDEANRGRARRIAGGEEARRAVESVRTIEERFHALLWTSYIGFWRRPISVPDGEAVMVPVAHGYANPRSPMLPMTPAEMEAKYGDGHYSERRALLGTMLQRLAARGIDLAAAHDVLRSAKAEDEQAYCDGHVIDMARFVYQERDVILRALRAAIRRAIDFYDRAIYAGFDPSRGVPVTIAPETINLLAGVARRLDPGHPEADPLWIAPPLPIRRHKAGRGATVARREQTCNALLELGISRRDARELLVAVGLAPWRPLTKRAARRRRICPVCDEPRLSNGPGDRYHPRCRSKILKLS